MSKQCFTTSVFPSPFNLRCYNLQVRILSIAMRSHEQRRKNLTFRLPNITIRFKCSCQDSRIQEMVELCQTPLWRNITCKIAYLSKHIFSVSFTFSSAPILIIYSCFFILEFVFCFACRCIVITI